MLLIRNDPDHQSHWTSEHHEQFLEKCESYINDLKRNGNLIAAQPLVREGTIIAGKKRAWKDIPYNETGEVQVGYYHILANDMDDATEITKLNPEFEYSETARIEVRPVQIAEQTTGFVYPKK